VPSPDKQPGIFPSIPWRHWVCLALILLGHTAANGYWLAVDRQPPLWDMALHQSIGIRYLDYYTGAGLQEKESWWDISGAYPPLYHHFLAFVFLFGRGSDTAVLGNTALIAMLLLGTYVLGRRWFSPAVGLLAAICLVCFPYMAWISRETVIDNAMAAVVLWTLIILDRCRGWKQRGHTLIFGALIASGAMTKWISPVFLALPAMYSWWKARSAAAATNRFPETTDSSRAAGNLVRPLTAAGRNLLDAAILSFALVLLWYGRKLPEILEFLRRNTLVGAAEGEPPVFSMASALYYLRLLEGQQLHAFFFLLAAAGAVYAWFRRRDSWKFLMLWIFSGYIGLTLLRTKDPRFSLPLLPAMAILCACWTEGISFRIRRGMVRGAIILAALGIFWLSSFGWDSIPREVVLVKGYQGALSWDWKLYSQDYFGLLGPPRPQIWPQEEILLRVKKNVVAGEIRQLGIVPDFPRFNHENLRLHALLSRWPIRVQRLGSLEGGGAERLAQMDFLLVAEGKQGMEWSTRENEKVNGYIFARPQQFVIDSFYTLPDGTHLRLYRVEKGKG